MTDNTQEPSELTERIAKNYLRDLLELRHGHSTW